MHVKIGPLPFDKKGENLYIESIEIGLTEMSLGIISGVILSRLIHSTSTICQSNVRSFQRFIIRISDNGLLNVFDIKNSYKLKSSTDYGEMLLPKEEEEEEEEGEEEGEEGEKEREKKNWGRGSGRGRRGRRGRYILDLMIC